jgi:hypothetical protein
MSVDYDPAAAPPGAAPLPPRQLTWREKRWQRRRRRIVFEEVLGWILVPVILVALYWGGTAALSALGTSPEALMQGIKAILNQAG